MSTTTTQPGRFDPAVASAADPATAHLRNRASWGAILAGVAAALTVQLMLNILGVGLGASTLDAANLGNNPAASNASLTTAGWIVGSGIVASLVGGLVAGRLAGSANPGTARWHGFLSWCATTLLLTWLLTTAVGGILGGTFSALNSTVGAVGRGAASTASGVAQSSGGDALQGQVRRLVSPNDAQSAQDDILTYLRAAVSGDTKAADEARDRAVDSLAHTANISPDEARARLQSTEDQARQAADTAKQKAQQAAEIARKSVGTAGLVGFAALALGALASIIGGGFGTPRAIANVAVYRRD